MNQPAEAPVNMDKGRDSESGLLGQLIFWFSIAFAIFHIWANTFATLPELTLSALQEGAL